MPIMPNRPTMPLRNSVLQRPVNSFGLRPPPPRNIGIDPERNNRGSNRDRQSRFDSRSRRRWGDWDILEVATPLLWLDDECILTSGDPLTCTALATADLWP